MFYLYSCLPLSKGCCWSAASWLACPAAGVGGRVPGACRGTHRGATGGTQTGPVMGERRSRMRAIRASTRRLVSPSPPPPPCLPSSLFVAHPVPCLPSSTPQWCLGQLRAYCMCVAAGKNTMLWGAPGLVPVRGDQLPPWMFCGH